MEMDQQPQAVDRRKRVERLKKMIVLSIVIGILVPWIVCAILLYLVVNTRADLQVAQRQLGVMSKTLMEQNTKLEEMSLKLEEFVSDENAKESLLEARVNELEALLSKRDQELTEEEAEEPEVMTHKVYLTFDDGPSIYTNEILDILKKYDVKATFFVLGKESEEAKQAMRRIVEEGHTLGMHSYSHQYEQIYASREAFAEDFQKIKDYLFQVTGTESTVYRFPGGSSNTVTNVDIHVFIQYLEEQNTPYFDWNVASGDAAKESLPVETILANATRGIETQPVSVILFHDAASRRTTVDALPLVIERILAMENTELLPITADTELIQHVPVQE
ncbi:MAG: polysaccharide deacetylase [Lachnospiraceae bacterium]|nr:polysaccharide deacetylase [Lachnospiraceae bacterium]